MIPADHIELCAEDREHLINILERELKGAEEKLRTLEIRPNQDTDHFEQVRARKKDRVRVARSLLIKVREQRTDSPYRV